MMKARRYNESGGGGGISPVEVSGGPVDESRRSRGATWRLTLLPSSPP